ncbi:MAG: sulfotransferase family protein [Candidatus Hydrogenedentota bacterium]|nr:MAG: sulfotransferase family protein [Candidatus Hydrogenedentota bacterium]
MQAALNQLGFRCYHMQEVPRVPGHLEMWNDIVVEEASPDWDTLFEEYQATVDAPACFYYRELLEKYPEAKVVLTVRDADRWYESIMTLLRTVKPLRPIGIIIPRVGRFMKLTDDLIHKFISSANDRESYLQAFDRHNAAVQRNVPADRLLVFHVQDGWEPLCEFLQCPVPESDPFPHLNEGSATIKAKMKEFFFTARVKAVLLLIGLGVLGMLAWLFMR